MADITGKSRRRRIWYLAGFLILLLVEVMIALFVHDRFIRPYFGDLLVVLVVYSFVRIFIPQKIKLLPLWVFIFAAAVEVLQLFDFVNIIGLGNNRFFRTLLGSTFDISDVICYFLGCILLGVHELLTRRKEKGTAENK